MLYPRMERETGFEPATLCLGSIIPYALCYRRGTRAKCCPVICSCAAVLGGACWRRALSADGTILIRAWRWPVRVRLATARLHVQVEQIQPPERDELDQQPPGRPACVVQPANRHRQRRHLKASFLSLPYRGEVRLVVMHVQEQRGDVRPEGTERVPFLLP